MTKPNKLIHYEKKKKLLGLSVFTSVLGGSMKKTMCNCYAL